MVTLRIYFIGLMAFVPSEDGRSVSVVIERAVDGHETSDGHRVEPHLPLFLARGACEGDCTPHPERIARFLYEHAGQPSTRRALQQLDSGLQGGTAWILDNVDLRFDLPGRAGASPLRFGPTSEADALAVPSGSIPKTPREARAFGWIAHMETISPAAARIDPDVLAPKPELGIVSARLKFDRGSLHTYRLADTESGIAKLAFQPVPATAMAQPPRAYAQWIALDIEMSVEECEQGLGVTARSFTDGQQRDVTIKPDCQSGQTIEMALVNLPSWQAARNAPTQAPATVGPHFELYYKLAQERLEASQRRVPVLTASAPRPSPEAEPPGNATSPLLEALHLTAGRGVYAQAICIPILFLPPQGQSES